MGIRPAVLPTPQRPGVLTAARAVRTAQQAAAREFRLQQTIGEKATPQRIGREWSARLVAEARQAAQRRIVQAEGRRRAQAAAVAARTLSLRTIRQHSRPVVPHLRTVVTKHALVQSAQRVVRLGSGMTAVIAYARSQVGKRYVSGGEGPYGFDCSGFTKRAYAQAGIRLPHSSGAQAALARFVPKTRARPGDLVVGPGHVGIYMGRGMMIDAGNHRTGVVYRRLYSGLRVARL